MKISEGLRHKIGGNPRSIPPASHSMQALVSAQLKGEIQHESFESNAHTINTTMMDGSPNHGETESDDEPFSRRRSHHATEPPRPAKLPRCNKARPQVSMRPSPACKTCHRTHTRCDKLRSGCSNCNTLRKGQYPLQLPSEIYILESCSIVVTVCIYPEDEKEVVEASNTVAEHQHTDHQRPVEHSSIASAPHSEPPSFTHIEADTTPQPQSASRLQTKAYDIRYFIEMLEGSHRCLQRWTGGNLARPLSMSSSIKSLPISPALISYASSLTSVDLMRVSPT